MLERGADVIIHSAANCAREVSLRNLYGYLDDNILLTERLVAAPHRKFVFISSVDVYPGGAGPHAEEEEIPADSARGVYAMSKMMSEAVVRQRCENHLILRMTTPLGPYTERGTTVRLIKDPSWVPALSGESRYNYVLYADLGDFIRLALEKDLRGTFNAAASGNIRLRDVARLLGASREFGAVSYDVGDIDNSRIRAAWPAFSRTSEENLARFLLERGKA